MSPNRQEARERPEPEEGGEPVPMWLWFVNLALVAWGFGYFLLYAGAASEIAGDSRTSAPATPPPTAVAAAPLDGAAIYTARCAACHQGDGKGVAGVFPPLAGSPWPTGDPSVPVRIVLHGLKGPIDVLGVTYQGAMPPFGELLSDGEIAAVVTHVRGSFGNAAPPVESALVGQTRAATAERKEAWTASELTP